MEKIRKLAERWNCPVLIEADGSRQRPLKAPADHEPVIPGFVDTVVVMAGLAGLGMPLDAEWVHRPERFSELSGLGLGIPVSGSALGEVLTHPAGGLKGIPNNARRVVMLNQADSIALQSHARGMVDGLLAGFHAVGIASLKQGEVFAMHERIAGVVLAAGGSKRLGQPKQLLNWHGKPFVKHVTDMALEAGLSPVFVVTGAFKDEVGEAVDGEGVLAHNPQWEEGQSTSVQRGLEEIPKETGGSRF
ncbi:MAG: putative selenium-dependent hydroxylase accessory protein YqeC, partial [Anaerolineae bacterium]|nr:putative selenium-dependent hydroxylase accessory protein YqeC [Anaerolineae bacterium]